MIKICVITISMTSKLYRSFHWFIFLLVKIPLYLSWLWSRKLHKRSSLVMINYPIQNELLNWKIQIFQVYIYIMYNGKVKKLSDVDSNTKPDHGWKIFWQWGTIASRVTSRVNCRFVDKNIYGQLVKKSTFLARSYKRSNTLFQK